MTTWTSPPLTDRVIDALARLEEPSRPWAPDRARLIATNVWEMTGTNDDVIATYTGADAPVPRGTVVNPRDGTVVFHAPFSRTALALLPAQEGRARFQIIDGPTLTIRGGDAPNGDWFSLVGVDRVDSEISELIALIPDVPIGWVVHLTRWGGTTAPQLSIDRGGPKSMPGAPTFKPAVVRESDGVIEIRATLGGHRTVVSTRPTHGMGEFRVISGIDEDAADLPASHAITCVTKRSGGSLDRRIVGVGGTANGKAWRIDADALVSRIEQGEVFHVGNIVVTVATGTQGNKYALAKDGRSNAILGLPKCRPVQNPSPPPTT